MALRRKGSAERIASWTRQSEPRADSEYVLAAVTIGEGSVVQRWEASAVAEDHATWARAVLEAAQDDCDERGQDTRYDLRHMVGGAVHATHVIRCKPTDEDTSALGMDGSVQGLIAQNQRHLEATQRMMFSSIQTLLTPIAQMMDHQQKRIFELENQRTMLIDAMPSASDEERDENARRLDKLMELGEKALPYLLPLLVGSGNNGSALSEAVAEVSE